MNGYGVKIVGDGVLPEGHEWVFTRTSGGGLLLILSRSSARSARVLAEVWAARISMRNAEPAALLERRMLKVC